MGSRNRLGLRRSLLAQEDAQDDQDAHREELRLPVLERLLPEIRLLQMLEDGLGRLLMPGGLLVGEHRAADRVEPER